MGKERGGEGKWREGGGGECLTSPGGIEGTAQLTDGRTDIIAISIRRLGMLTHDNDTKRR